MSDPFDPAAPDDDPAGERDPDAAPRRAARARPPRRANDAQEVEVLLRRLRDEIDSARPMPLSTSVMVSREELLDIVDQALERLPDELRAARWLLKEREEFLAKVRREGDDILDQARARAERMVQRTEVVKAAEQRARKIVEKAQEQSRQLRNEAEDFCDQRLASFEIILERTMKMVESGRAKLASASEAAAAEVVRAREPQADEVPVSQGPAVFDQDL